MNAFPQSNDRVVASLSIADSQGMTLRDYFAAKAMEQVNWSKTGVIAGAETCFELADAMMEARNAAQ